MRHLARALLITSLAVALPACSTHTSIPKALPPQTMAPTPPETEEPITNAEESLEPQTGLEPLATGIEVVEETPTAYSPADATDDSGVTVVLDPGDEIVEQPQTLFAASEAEKERREEAGESEIVLTNKNLKDYSKGQLTFVEDDEAESASEGDSPVVEPISTQADEEYWRERVLEIRIGWREALDQIADLESEVARLRRDFYAEDDPFYRDSQIKPAWDEALDDLEQAKRDVEESQRVLDATMEEGHRAGALPGWLREGVELEPTEEELEELLPRQQEEGIHEPSEPVILDEDDGNGG